MRFDDDSFDATALVVWNVNQGPWAGRGMTHYATLREYMENMAFEHCHTPGSVVSTGGFVLSSFRASDGETMVRASVSPSVVIAHYKL